MRNFPDIAIPFSGATPLDISERSHTSLMALKPVQIVHRRIISPFVLKLILFILMIAGQLPGGHK